MRKLEVDVVVIGGGATGSAVVRDVAMRGFKAALVDRVDLAQGTTARFHGLLHSGGRYVKSDPESATECAEENDILRRVVPHAIEDTGGLFVTTSKDSEEHADIFLECANNTKVPAYEISPAEALKREPRLDPKLKRAFAVQDATIDGWKMVWGFAHSAKEYGAEILTYHWVTGIEVTNGAVSAVTCEGHKNGGEKVRIECKFIINCGGPWAGEIAAMAGCHDVNVVPGAGIMIAMNHRICQHVINRCIYPSDGDLIVPAHQVAIIGTTDQVAPSADFLQIKDKEVQQMLDAGDALLPGFRHSRPLHVWVGARPLVKDNRVAATDSRHMSRGMSVMDHEERDGVKGMLTVAGGKLTTCRLMAERAVNIMCDIMKDERPCRTAQEAVPGQEGARQHRLTDRLQAREKEWNKDQIICECELVSRRMVEETIQEFPNASLDDLRRQLRIGMGPCQGGFCSMRCAGIVNEEGAASVERATNMISLFMKNRWIGIKPILFGESARETALDNWIMQGIFDLEHAPGKGQLSEVKLNPVEQERDKQEREAVKEALA